MKEKQILIIKKEPGKAPEIDPLFENSLENFQKAVGGYIEIVTIATNLVIICNEEGRLLGLPHNCSFCGCDFCGTILFVGVKGDEFASLPATVIPTIRNIL